MKVMSYTQVQALKRLNIPARAADCLALIEKHGPLSRRQMAVYLGIESNSTTSGVHWLIKEGFAVELVDSVFDEETNCHQRLIAVSEGNTRPVNTRLTVKQQLAMVQANYENAFSALEETEAALEESERRLALAAALLKHIAEQSSSFDTLLADFNQMRGAV